MKLSISNIAWAAEDDAQVAPLIVAGGADGVELAPTKYWPAPCRPGIEQLKAKRQWWEDQGLPITSLQALLFGMNALNIFGSATVLDETLDYLERIAHLGEALGAKRLVFGSPRNRDRGSLSSEEALARAAGFFRRLCERVADLNTVFVLEPNPPQYACNFVTTASEAYALVRAVDHPKLALHLDAGIMQLNEEAPNEVVEKCAPLLAHVHISEPWLAPVGKNREHHASFARALHRMRYSGCLSIEMRSQNDLEADRLAVSRALEEVRGVYQSRDS